MHEVLVNRLGGLSLPRKSVVRLTDRPDMTLDVYRGRKTTIQPTNFHCYMLDESICHFRGVGSILSLLFYFRWKILCANNVYPDQMPHDVASDLGLHCSPVTLLQVSRREWVNSIALFAYDLFTGFKVHH